MLLGIGRLGAATCTIFSQQRQDFFSRATSTTFICTAIMSRISLVSSPTRRNSPPHSGQQEPGSSSRRSRTALSETRGRRRMIFSDVSAKATTDASSSGSSIGAVLLSAAAINRSSSASANCSISTTALLNRRVRPQVNRSSTIPEHLSRSSATSICTAFTSTGMNNAFDDAERSPFFFSSLRQA